MTVSTVHDPNKFVHFSCINKLINKYSKTGRQCIHICAPKVMHKFLRISIRDWNEMGTRGMSS